MAETDASGNCINAWRVPLVTYGKNTHQTEALIGDAVASVVAYAREVRKPIVIEKLDFRQKKAALEGESPRYSRMLSSFSYGKVKAYFISRGYRQGVEVHQVNPAYSSVIGRVKFMERYGLTVHQAAGLVLARRLLGCSERIPRRWVCPRRQWRTGRLHRTREEASEARVDVLGCDLGAVRPALCGATPLGSGDADRRLQRSTGWGGGALNCIDRIFRNRRQQFVTKVNHFYNGDSKRTWRRCKSGRYWHSGSTLIYLV